MKLIKTFESFSNENNIKDFVDLEKIDFDYHVKYNLQAHSGYSDGEDSEDESTIHDLLDRFDKILKRFFLKNNEMVLYRMVMLDNPESLKKPYGIYWAYKEQYAQVIDDEGYEGERGNTPYILKATFDIKDINWTETFNLYLMNEFMEGEIRTFENSEPKNIEIKKSI